MEDGRCRHWRFDRKKDNLQDACKGLSKEGMLDLADVIGLYIRK